MSCDSASDLSAGSSCVRRKIESCTQSSRRKRWKGGRWRNHRSSANTGQGPLRLQRPTGHGSFNSDTRKSAKPKPGIPSIAGIPKSPGSFSGKEPIKFPCGQSSSGSPFSGNSSSPSAGNSPVAAGRTGRWQYPSSPARVTQNWHSLHTLGCFIQGSRNQRGRDVS